MTEIKEYISKFVELLPVSNSVSVQEAEKRASEFLRVQSQIIDWKHEFSKEKIRLLSLQSVVYSHEMSKCEGKTVTKDKIVVEASEAYLEARESLESIENDIAYLKSYLDVFQNAHLFFRNLAKGDGF